MRAHTHAHAHAHARFCDTENLQIAPVENNIPSSPNPPPQTSPIDGESNFFGLN